MTGQVQANLSDMPLENILAISGSAAVIFVLIAVIIYVLIKRLRIVSFGPLKLEQQNQTTMYSMNEATKEADDICRRQMRQITSNMKIHISNIFAELNICVIARLAISSAIRFPLYESVANNHFTTELMPDNYTSYRDRIVEMMGDEYVSMASLSNNINCGKERIPPWEEIQKKLISCIDLWLKRISRETLINCEKKIAVYEQYLLGFKDANDKYRIGIVYKCIEKNKRYIEVLKIRAGENQ